MRLSICLPLLGNLLFAATVCAYEWKTHNGMAQSGRDAFIGSEPTHRPPYTVDDELRTFLVNYGVDLDTRAGNPCDVTRDVGCKATDEDHNEGELFPFIWCVYHERSCWPSCTFDHFFPRLPWPLANQEAVSHAYEYFAMAIKLYKAAKCDTLGLSEEYFRGAARALGHAIHLVEDMGSPQHARPENHAPPLIGLIRIGNGPSFHEYWTLNAWSDTQGYIRPDTGALVPLGNFERAAAASQTPRPGNLMGIMGKMAAEARAFPEGSPYPPGSGRALGTIEAAFADAGMAEVWETPEKEPCSSHDTACLLSAFTVDQFPSYRLATSDVDRHTYVNSSALLFVDFLDNGAVPSKDRDIGVLSFDLAERLWAQSDPRHPDNPVTFDRGLQTLVTHTTEAAAGAILAFWDEVKGFKTCPCNDFTPCAFRNGADKPPDCDGAPSKSRAGGDSADDNAAVLATAAAGTAETGSVANADAPFLARRWRDIAAVGVEKGIPSLVDLGRASWLIEVGVDETLDEHSKTVIAQAIGGLERKYSATIPRPEHDLPRAAHVAVFARGYDDAAGALLDRLGILHVSLTENFDPLLAAEETPVLLVPSGGLYGSGSSDDLRDRFRSFVEHGGSLLVLGQVRGADFAVVPTPAGETLHGYGWFEDQSCTRDSVVLAATHPITASATRELLSLPVDGFFDQWPTTSTVLLRRASTGAAAMLTYPLGRGWIVASSSYDDQSGANGSASKDGVALLANAIAWARDTGHERNVCRAGESCAADVSVEIKNLTEDAADIVQWEIVDPFGRRVASWQEPLALDPQHRLQRTETIGRSLGDAVGVLRLRYTLLDAARTLHRTGGTVPWVVQPTADAGQFITEMWPDTLRDAPPLILTLAVDAEQVPNFGTVPAHISIRNNGTSAFAGTVRLSYSAPNHRGWTLLTTLPVTAQPGELVHLDAPAGPLDLQVGHDGLPGGGVIRAELMPLSGTTPMATALKWVLTNARFLDGELRATVAEAGPGDNVGFVASLANATIGSLSGRYRLVFTNHGNVLGDGQPVERTDWRPFTVGAGDTTTLGADFVVPPRWQGRVDARLYVCYPDLQCWTTGDELRSAWIRYSASVALPMSRVAITLGEPAVVTGPAFKIPVRVANIGPRTIVNGQLALSQLAKDAPPVTSAVFGLQRGEETVLEFELPFSSVANTPGSWTTTASFTDELWRAREPSLPWQFATTGRIRYGGQVTAPTQLKALPGSGAIRGRLALDNLSTMPRTLTATLVAPDLGFSRELAVTLLPAATTLVDVEIPIDARTPYGLYPLDVALSDGLAIEVTRRFHAWVADPGVALTHRTASPAVRAGAPVTFVVEAVPRSIGGEVEGAIELQLDDATFAESRPAVIAPGRSGEAGFDVALPADMAAGAHELTVRWRESNGYEVQRTSTLVVPPAKFSTRLTTNRAVAGGTIDYDVNNEGGAGGVFAPSWRLESTGQVVVEVDDTVTMPAAGNATTGFAVPEGLRSGSYLSRLSFTQGSGERVDIVDAIDISGVEATLAVTTDRDVYPVGGLIVANGTVVNGATALSGARVHLELLGQRAACAPMTPWGMFQGAASRAGSCALGMAEPGRGSIRFVPVAGMPTSGTVLASASGDLDADGYDDVVAVESDGATSMLTVYGGPDLAPRAAVPLGAGLAHAGVAVADTDGDDDLEVAAIGTVDDRSATVWAWSSRLAPLWQSSHAAATGCASAWPAGGPLVADLDGDGFAEVVVSTGGDIVALDWVTGAQRWNLSSLHPELAAWQVTGTAAGDVDGDGRDEVAIGLAASATSSAGRLVLLDGGGSLRWQRDTTNPIVGSPVIVHGGRDTSSVVAVHSPTSSLHSSALIRVRAEDGSALWETTVAFWSRFQPAAGDVDGDDEAEFAVPSGDAGCSDCALNGMLLFDGGGDLAWFDSNMPPPASPPAIVDIDGNGLRDVIAVTAGAGYDPELIGWDGENGWYMAWGPSTENPLGVLDVDGDCHPEVLSGAFALTTVATPAGVRREDGETGDPLGRALLWSWDGPIDAASGEAVEFAVNPSTQGKTGAFVLVGELENAPGQLLARAETTFTVVPSSLELVLMPLATAYAVGADVPIAGSIRNTGAVEETVNVIVSTDDVGLVDTAVTIPPGDEQAVSAVGRELVPGLHTANVKIRRDGETLAEGALPFLVENPAVEAILTAPAGVGTEPFQVEVELRNPTHLPLDLEATLATGGEAPGEVRAIHLEPTGRAVLIFDRSIVEETVFTLGISGDASAEESATVVIDAIPSLSLAGPVVLPAGNAVLHVTAANGSLHGFRGDMRWQLVGATTAAGSLPLELAAGARTDLFIPVELAAGASTLDLEVLAQHTRFDLEAYTDGRGTMQVRAPAQSMDGDVEVPIEITNLEATTGGFVYTLEARRDGDVVTRVTRAWTLPGVSTINDEATAPLTPGSYTLVSRLNDDPSSEVTNALEVVARRAISLEAGSGEPNSDSGVPISVTVTNRGLEPAAGSIVVSAPTSTVVLPYLSPAGGSVPLLVGLDPDTLPTGENRVDVRALDGAGSVDATRHVSFVVRPPQLALQVPAVPVEAMAGNLLHVALPVLNIGHKSAAFQVTFELGGGTVFSHSEVGWLAGATQTAVEFDVSLPIDLAAGALDGRVTLTVADESGSFTTVQSAILPLDVHTPRLEVRPALVRNHAVANDVIPFTLSVSAPDATTTQPAFVIVSYGDFEARRDIYLSSDQVRLDFDVPIDEPGRDLSYGVYWPTGKAAYLDQTTIHAGNGDVVLSTSREEYTPGETIDLDVELGTPGTLELFAFGQSATLTESGPASLDVPPGTAWGRFPIVWTLYRTGPNGGIVNGEHPVRIRGPRVRLPKIDLDRNRVMPGDTVKLHATVLSDSALGATMKVWLRRPGGDASLAAETPVDLVAAQPREVDVEVPVVTDEAGIHTLVVGIVGAADGMLSDGSALLDVGAASIMGVRVLGRGDEPGGVVLPAEPPVAEIHLRGSGAGVLSLSVDDTPVRQLDVTLTGTQRIAVELPASAPGPHRIDATFAAGGLVSHATAPFFIRNSAPDIALVRAVPAVLSPITHGLVTVSLTGATDPDGDTVTLEITAVRQDEAVASAARWDLSPDATTSPLALRAEAAADGDGRVYHIAFTASDGRGGTAAGETTVCVPLPYGSNRCGDGGALFDSTVPARGSRAARPSR